MKLTKRIIGITGGVGCGKSEVLSYLKDTYNAHIILSDQVAKNISKPGGEAYSKICKAFPDAIIDYEINNQILSDIVFRDKEKLKELNEIVHPLTLDTIKKEIDSSNADIVVVESAIFFESGLDKFVDEVWWVFCDLETRIQRLNVSRGYSREKSLGIINNQMSDEELNLKTDEYIDNSKNFEKTKEQIDFIISDYCTE